jgi:hypothetical protein
MSILTEIQDGVKDQGLSPGLVVDFVWMVSRFRVNRSCSRFDQRAINIMGLLLGCSEAESLALSFARISRRLVLVRGELWDALCAADVFPWLSERVDRPDLTELVLATLVLASRRVPFDRLRAFAPSWEWLVALALETKDNSASTAALLLVAREVELELGVVGGFRPVLRLLHDRPVVITALQHFDEMAMALREAVITLARAVFEGGDRELPMNLLGYDLEEAVCTVLEDGNGGRLLQQSLELVVEALEFGQVHSLEEELSSFWTAGLSESVLALCESEDECVASRAGAVAGMAHFLFG